MILSEVDKAVHNKTMTAAQSLSSSVLLLCPARPLQRRVARTQLSDFEFSKKLTLDSSHKFSRRSRTTTLRGINSNDSKESAFFDENGVVEDMDSYLNYLSLEYDSVWDTKPSCGSMINLTLPVITKKFRDCKITYHLKAYSDMIEERRKRVTNGLEDTYGARKNQ